MVRQQGAVIEVDLDGHTVFLLNEGKPINFLDQSILGRVLDLVYTELYMCIRALAQRDQEPGVGMLGLQTQRSIADVWCPQKSVGVPA